MHQGPMLALLFAGAVLGVGSAAADDADDLAEIARLQRQLHAQVPANLRVFSAEFGSGVTLMLRASKSAPQQAWIRSGSDWVELKPSGYSGTSCSDAGIAIGEFSLEAGMRAYYKARAIAQVVLDLLTEPGMVDHQLLEAGGGQGAHVVLDQRLAAGAHQRLGGVQGQGAQALALAGGEDHRLHAGCPSPRGRAASSPPSSASSGRRASTRSRPIPR